MTARKDTPMATAPVTTVARAKSTTVLYDGRCEFCRRSVRFLKKLDWRGRLQFADGRDPANLPATKEPLDPRRLLEEMHVVTPDGRRVYHGFGAFRRIAWLLPPLWLLVPFLYIPGVPWLGQRLYLWVAKNRFHLIPCHDGQCQVMPKQ